MSEQQESNEMAAAAAGRCPVCYEARPDLSTPCPNCGAPPLGPADPGAPRGETRRSATDAIMQVRATDLEPYIGLRYLSKLFRLIAIILVIVLIAEVITGLVRYGSQTIPQLVGEASRLIVFAALLWGVGDLAILVIDVGHDIRATRILVGRQAAHQLADQHRERRRDGGADVRREARAEARADLRADARGEGRADR
jgi:hypothetical protein